MNPYDTDIRRVSPTSGIGLCGECGAVFRFVGRSARIATEGDLEEHLDPAERKGLAAAWREVTASIRGAGEPLDGQQMAEIAREAMDGPA